MFQNITKGSAIKGSAILVVLAGAQGVYLTKWGMFDFFLTGIPSWSFGVLASIGGVLFFLGPMIYGSASVNSMRQVSKESEKMLFLYLRPFELDARNIMQLMVGASTGILVYAGLMDGLWWVICFVPLAINISKEQSFQAVFEPLGEFIAIGDPGVKLQPIGASRVYVNSNWQQEVINYMTRSRLVIVRPGKSKGIQWEIRQLFDVVSNDRILFYLRFRGRKRKKEKAYETFRSYLPIHIRIQFPLELPKQLEKAPYLIFDSAWIPYFIPEANRLKDLIGQIFSRSGDVTTDSFRPVLKALGIEPYTQPNNLLNTVTVAVIWLFALINIGLVFIFIVLAVVALALFCLKITSLTEYLEVYFQFLTTLAAFPILSVIR